MHEPLQFDFVEVSGTNQYRVCPLLLVSTVVLPIFMVPRVFAEDAAPGELPPEPPEPPEPEDELPHAATTSTAATAPAGTSHLFRMTCLRSDEINRILIPRSEGLVRSPMVHVYRPGGAGTRPEGPPAVSTGSTRLRRGQPELAAQDGDRLLDRLVGLRQAALVGAEQRQRWRRCRRRGHARPCLVDPVQEPGDPLVRRG